MKTQSLILFLIHTQIFLRPGENLDGSPVTNHAGAGFCVPKEFDSISLLRRF